MRIVRIITAVAFALAMASAESDADEHDVLLAQSNKQPVFFRTSDLLIAFVPEPFSFFPFDEYREFGVRSVVRQMESWSGLKIKQSNTAPNMVVMRDRGFDAVIESDDPLVRSLLMQFFGPANYQQNARAAIGAEENCFTYNVTTRDLRINATLVLLNSSLKGWEEAICTVQGIASAFGVSSKEMLDTQIVWSEETGTVVLGEEVRRAFSETYVF